jgi:hypothetical protein
MRFDPKPFLRVRRGFPTPPDRVLVTGSGVAGKQHSAEPMMDACTTIQRPSAATESELQFFSRRALEESRAATRAICPQAAAAHRYLAAAYSARVRQEIATAAELDALARLIA